MRIGFFTDGFPPQTNGVATTVYESMEALIKKGHEVFVVAPKYPKFKDKGKNIFRISSIPMSKNPDVRIGLSLPEKELRDMDFDLIHGHSGGPISFLGWEIARGKSIPYIITYHTLWNKYTHYFLKGAIVKPKMMEVATRVFGNRSDMMLAPSKRVARELKAYGVKAPIEVVPSGINISRFKNVEGGFLRKKLRLDQESKILLFVGRLGKEKSVDFLVEAFAGLDNPDTYLVLVGDGPEKKALKDLARKLGVNDEVFFLGEVDHEDIPKVYKDSTIFVFSSRSETQGMVIPEALASSLPVVALKDPTIEEYVKNGKNGFIAKDKNDFVNKIKFLLTSPKYSTFSSEAAKSALSMDSEESVQNLLKVYKKVLASYRRDHLIRFVKRNRLYEEFFLLNLSFWLSILTMRLIVNISFYSRSFPKILSSIINSHQLIGLIIVLICFAYFKKNGRFTLLSLFFFGVGVGFFVDNLYPLFTGHIFKFSFYEYWSFGNLLTIITFGFFLIFLPKILRLNNDFVRFKDNKKLPTLVEPPRISVIVPALNEEKFLSRTLESLINQTYKKFEVIIVDNNSFDKTQEIAKDYGAKVILEYKKSSKSARQAGLDAANGEIAAFTTAGTILPHDWLEKIATEFENEHIVAYGGMTRLYSGPVTARLASRYLGNLLWLRELMSGELSLNNTNMAIRRDAAFEAGGFTDGASGREEEILTEKLKKIGEVKINKNFIVFLSGRKYRRGYLYGIATSVSSDVSRIIGKERQDIVPIREEKSFINKFSFIPFAVGILLLVVMFSSFNPDLADAKEVIMRKGGVFYLQKKIKSINMSAIKNSRIK